MEYREFGQTGLRVSRLGFGAMRLPQHPDKKINPDQAVALLREGLDLGINFFDSAWVYNNGQSEEMIGKAFQNCRDKVVLQTKIHFGKEQRTSTVLREMLETQLRRLRTDYLDILLTHDLRKQAWEKNRDAFLEMTSKARQDGILRHVGLSTHDKIENIHEHIDSGHFEVILMQYNLLDRKLLPAFEHAREKGMGLEVMGPVAGGRLAQPSREILNLLPGKTQSTAEIALRFVLANPIMDVVLSGMSDFQQLRENVETAGIEEPLSEEERKKVLAVLEEKKRLAELYCTGCRYCMPCPQNVAIPHIFTLMNAHRLYGMTKLARKHYAKLGPENPAGDKATACVECGECEEKCPQNIPVIQQLKESHQVLG